MSDPTIKAVKQVLAWADLNKHGRWHDQIDMLTALDAFGRLLVAEAEIARLKQLESHWYSQLHRMGEEHDIDPVRYAQLPQVMWTRNANRES